jgi:tRNA pseudouridine38-40 synthase
VTAPRRIRLDVAYDGTEFAGWQAQPGLRTVQGSLEEALASFQDGERVVVRGAGRTDAGVHAEQQVADFALATRLDDDTLARALRGILPDDLRPLRVATLAGGFSAQGDAVDKTYRYRIDLTPHRDPFLRRYALHYPHRLDLDRVARALARLPGRRDWSGFTAAGCTVRDRTRNLTEARLAQPGPGELHLYFRADGFLQHMVRNLVGTVLDIGGGRKPLDLVERIFATGDRTLAGPTVAAHGLCLVGVRYEVVEGPRVERPRDPHYHSGDRGAKDAGEHHARS